MRALQQILSFSFLLLWLACAYHQVHASLTEEIQKLADQEPDNIVALDDKTFPKFIESGHDYSVLVVFSVRSNAFNCEPCM
jgi:hypothetical protein